MSGANCPYCRTAFEADDEIVACPGVLHSTTPTVLMRTEAAPSSAAPRPRQKNRKSAYPIMTLHLPDSAFTNRTTVSKPIRAILSINLSQMTSAACAPGAHRPTPPPPRPPGAPPPPPAMGGFQTSHVPV